MAKILSACVAEDLVSLVERYKMFPKNHFGGRSGQATNDSLMLTIHWIHEKWRKGKVVSALFLDIQGAYHNVVVLVLIHEMCSQGVPKEYTDWAETKLSGRKTTLQFDDFVSKPFNVINGEDQGCPASTVWYGFYNASLVDLSGDPAELKSAFIDDTVIMVSGPSPEANNIRPADMMKRTEGAIDWSTSHNSPFKVDKFGLLHFTRKQIPNSNKPRSTMKLPRPPLDLNRHIIPASTSHKFLLSFKVAIAKNKEKFIKEDEANSAPIKIYSDGSGYKCMIGSSVVMYCYRPGGGRIEKSLQYCLGPKSKYTICNGETVGFTLAAHLLAKERGGRASN